MLISSEGYCKLLLTGSRMMCVSAAACSGSVQFCLSVDPVSHFHTLSYKEKGPLALNARISESKNR